MTTLFLSLLWRMFYCALMYFVFLSNKISFIKNYVYGTTVFPFMLLVCYLFVVIMICGNLFFTFWFRSPFLKMQILPCERDDLKINSSVIEKSFLCRVSNIMQRDAQKDPAIFPDALHARTLVNQVLFCSFDLIRFIFMQRYWLLIVFGKSKL